MRATLPRSPPPGSSGAVAPIGHFVRPDGTHVISALDLDSDQGWVAWTEDEDGARCCETAEEVISPCPLDELHDRALETIAGDAHG
jgi:hypothetical protein